MCENFTKRKFLPDFEWMEEFFDIELIRDLVSFWVGGKLSVTASGSEESLVCLSTLSKKSSSLDTGGILSTNYFFTYLHCKLL